MVCTAELHMAVILQKVISQQHSETDGSPIANRPLGLVHGGVGSRLRHTHSHTHTLADIR